MPQLSHLVQKRKFIKKEYRPWDLSGTGTVDAKEKTNEDSRKEIDSVKTAEMEDIHSLPLGNENMLFQMNEVTGNETGNVTGNETGNKQVTNRQQTGNKQVTIQEQTGNNEVTTRQQTGNKTGNVTDNTEHLIYLVETIKKLSGIQENIFFYVINICSSRGCLDTGNILSSDLSHAANCSIGSAKTSLIRLIAKQLVFRYAGKASRGGHMVLGITKAIQAATIQAQQTLFNPLKLTKTGNNTGNITGNTAYSSSSILYKNNTTTTSDLPEEWKKINYELLSSIGFSTTQLKQLYEKQLNIPEVIQESVKHFAFALEKNPKVQSYPEPLNVLMGVLRKGGVWHEPNYISPADLALQQIVEEKKRIKEKRDQMLKELTEFEFPQWRKSLTESQIKEIVPTEIMKMNVSAAITSSLRVHYVENVLLPQLEKDDIKFSGYG